MRRLVSAALALSIVTAFATSARADGSEKTVQGVIEDSYCYGTMGAHGESHKSCAIKCIKAGIPASLVENNTGAIYVLLPKNNEQPLPDDVINKAEDQVTVTGKEYSKGGVNFLVIESVK
jgi:hypothetical protein